MIVRSLKYFSIVLLLACSINMPGELHAGTTTYSQIITPRMHQDISLHSFFHRFYNNKSDFLSGGNLQATAFYQKNHTREQIAEGLGIGTGNTIRTEPGSSSAKVDSDHLIHIIAGTRPHATIKLTPFKQVWGGHLSYYQDLDFLSDGFYMLINATAIQQKTKLQATFSDESEIPPSISIKQFFQGQDQGLAAPLEYGKLSSTEDTRNGIDELYAYLGVHFIDRNEMRIGAFVSATVPTGPLQSVEFIFPAHVGSRHYGFGGGITAYLKLGGDDKTNWHIFNKLHGSYRFQNLEQRLPTVKNLPWGHYYQAQQHGTLSVDDNGNSTRVFPLANFLAQDLEVHPGILMENMVMLSYHYKTLTIDLGYKVAYQEEEKNKFHKPWPNYTYAIVHKDLDPINYSGHADINDALAFDIKGTFPDGAADPLAQAHRVINDTDLVINLPTAVMHELSGSIGQTYSISKHDFEVGAAVGGSIFFGEPHQLIAKDWRLWAKLALAF